MDWHRKLVNSGPGSAGIQYLVCERDLLDCDLAASYGSTNIHNLLAALFDSTLELCDELCRCVRTELANRMTLFTDLQALTSYLYPDSWHTLKVRDIRVFTQVN